MPDLTLIPSGTGVFVDTNIFCFHFQGRSASCTVFMERIARDEVTAYVNTEVLSDLLHKMMLAEAVVRGIINKPRAVDLKTRIQADRSVVARLSEHQRQFEATLNIGLKVLPISKHLLVDTKTERADHGLLTNDSLHLGCMNRHRVRVKNIATYDDDFSNIADVTIWRPSDVVV